MGIFVLLVRVALAGVFAVAGLGKLFDLQGSRESMVDFGAPKPLAPALALLLPLIELISATALLVDAWAWQGAAGIAALLILFTLAIVYNLAQGRKPDCHCFGQIKSDPVGPSTVVRNAALLAVAALVGWETRAGVGLWSSLSTGPRSASPAPWTTLEMVLAGVTAALATGLGVAVWVLFHMLHQNGRILLRLEAVEKKLEIDPNAVAVPGLPVGTPAPPLRLTSLEGQSITLEMLLERGSSMLLLFSDIGCGACDALMPQVAEWQREHQGRLLIVPISGGGLEPNLAKHKQHGLQNLLLQAGRETPEAYRVSATPSAVLVTEGKIASPLAEGSDAILRLVTKATLPAPAKMGDAVPTLKLAGLDGATLDLGSLRGRRRLVLFWNPGCGYCQAMLDDVKQWERNPPRDAPELLIISGGSAEDNRKQGFRAPVLLDPDWGVGSVLGANGTPSAVMLDEEGRVASEVGVGAERVLALAGVSK